MSIETNIATVADYRYSSLPNSQTAINYINTVHKETHRKPDEYFFGIGPEGMIDPATGDYIHNMFAPISHSNRYLGRAEFTVIDMLDKWSLLETPGTAIWITPEYHGEYPCNKVIVHQKAILPSGERTLQNIAILFDCPKEQCLRIMQCVFPELKSITDPEQLRWLILSKDENFDPQLLVEQIQAFIPKSKNYKDIPKQDLIYLASLITNGKSSAFLANEMLRMGYLGEYDISCPSAKNFSEFTAKNSNQFVIENNWTYHIGDCINCNAKGVEVGPCSICKPCEKIL